MVHVGMGHEDVVDLQELPRRYGMEISEIKQQGAPPLFKLEIDSRIAEGIVDEMCAEHERLPVCNSAGRCPRVQQAASRFQVLLRRVNYRLTFAAI